MCEKRKTIVMVRSVFYRCVSMAPGIFSHLMTHIYKLSPHGFQSPWQFQAVWQNVIMWCFLSSLNFSLIMLIASEIYRRAYYWYIAFMYRWKAVCIGVCCRGVEEGWTMMADVLACWCQASGDVLHVFQRTRVLIVAWMLKLADIPARCTPQWLAASCSSANELCNKMSSSLNMFCHTGTRNMIHCRWCFVLLQNSRASIFNKYMQCCHNTSKSHFHM